MEHLAQRPSLDQLEIVDLHSDLLSYLTCKPERTPRDPFSRSSYPQLSKGGVKVQTLAIFSTTSDASVENGRRQVNALLDLLKQDSALFCSFPQKAKGSQIQVIAAFENASSFAHASEPLSNAIQRLEGYLKLNFPIFYIGLTWDHENRFGGGNLTDVGLKDDGRRLLAWMSGKSIAIDLSHTSDQLAYDVIDEIEKRSLDVPLLASHSNFRAISNYPRNLPEDIAKEIIRKKGLIGVNFFAPFVHPTDPSAIALHLEYGLNLGGENSLCFGADFFCDADHPDIAKKYKGVKAYHPELGNSSVYPQVLELFAQRLQLSHEQLQKIASQNALRYLTGL